MWIPILTGILFSVLVPLFILTNAYSIAQHASSFVDITLKLDEENTSANLEKYGNTNQKLNSNSKAIERSIIFTPNLSYIPVLGQEIFSWKLEIQKLTSHLNGGIVLFENSLSLFETIEKVNSSYTSESNSTVALQESKLEIDFIETNISKSLVKMNKQKKLSRQHRPLFSPSNYLETKLDLEQNETRIANTSSVVHSLIGIFNGYIDIAEMSQPFNKIIYGSSSSSYLSYNDLSVTLQKMSQESNILNVKAQGLLSSIDSIELYKKSSLEEFLFLFTVVLESIEHLSLISGTIISSIQSANTNDGMMITQRPIFTILKNINNNHDSLSNNLEQLKMVKSKINSSKSNFSTSKVIDQIEIFEKRTDKVVEGISLLTDIAPLATEILNSSTTQTYLILGHSSDELRATGGFVSSLWTIEFDATNGVQTRYFDTVRVDDWNKLELYPPPPDGLKQNMNAHVWLLRDVSWEPDFPTTANIASDMFQLGQNVQVDGVVGINQWVLVKLIESIGNIESPSGGFITPLNFLSKIEEGTDNYGRAYTDLVLDRFLEKIFKSNQHDLNFFISSAGNLNQLLNSKEISIYLTNPDFQKVIKDKGWAGEIKSVQDDYLFVIDSNVGWSKSDRNIERETYYEIDFSKNPPRVNLKLKYINHSGPGSVPCNPQWINRGTNYNQLKNACYWNYWRVYTANNVNILSHTNTTVKDYSVASQVGFEYPNDDSFGIESLYDYNIFSGLSDIEAGESESINLIYDLPKEVLRIQENTIKYSLLIQKQSGVRKRYTKLKLILPNNYRFISSNQIHSIDDKNHVVIELQLTEDTYIDILIEKIP